MMATMKLTRADQEALQRALDMARAQSDQERAHIDRELAEDGWQHAAETAAYHCQDRALRLKPWQTPPCWLRTDAAVQVALLTPPPDHRGRRMAAGLVLELLAAGLSRFEPDPLHALAKADKAASKRGQPDAVTADRAER
jgi:hypothetical protein